MGGLLWLMATLALPLTAPAHGLAQAAGLVVLISGGMAIYGLLLALFGVIGWGEAVSAIRQTRPPTCATDARVAMDGAWRLLANDGAKQREADNGNG